MWISKAKFSQKTKQEIAERDWCCIFCTKSWPPHHLYFWIQSERTPDRNKSDRWVILCMEHHLMAHACKSGEGIRQECIDYLTLI
jgi:hypothetical protein